MLRSNSKILLVLLGLQFVLANVEKIIFHGPSGLWFPITEPTLRDLHIHALSPERTTLRTELLADFPTSSAPKGKSSWILLSGLTGGERYEVRVCWAATQPTSFYMFIYELPEVFQSTDLLTSLAQNTPLMGSTPDIFMSIAKQDESNRQPILLLQIFAAANYYTTNHTLMEHVPPVVVDIILDPYVFNIFPSSLVPTAGYLIIITACSWHVAKIITRWLQMVARDQLKKDL